MNICPITGEDVIEGEYSSRGLRQLAPALSRLAPFPYDQARQLSEAAARADKMSIQGVQPKLSVRLNRREGRFEIVDRGGEYILKPAHPQYPQLPENEALTMSLADIAGIEVPVHGLIRCVDGTFSYFIRRFDRLPKGGKVATEDFCQLSGLDRERKYASSLERVADIFSRCTFPLAERARFLHLCLFCFVIGNEDMHLKNFSLIRRNGKIALSPAYDLLNTTLAWRDIGRRPEEIEEVALPLAGRKRRLSRRLWLEDFARGRLELPEKTIAKILRQLAESLPAWEARIARSFLSPSRQELYREIARERLGRISHQA
jgi:serine/threonine-protein kinase HipA